MFFRPSYPKNAISIEREYLAAVELQKRSSTYSINKASIANLPEGLLTPSFSEKNIADIEELAHLVQEAVQNADLRRQKRWSVALPDETAQTIIITLETEPKSQKELYEVLDWKVEKTLGIPAEQLRIAHENIGTDDSGKKRYIVTAINLSVLEEYENLFEQMRWHVGLILPRLVGEIKLLTKASEADSLLLSFRREGFSAVLLRNSIPFFLRSVVCEERETDDEIYRLLMFYKERLSPETPESLKSIMIIGRQVETKRLSKILNETLTTEPKILISNDLMLDIPSINLDFFKIAAPAGIATLAWG
ncbi:MAG: hypothetical protein D6687_06825 [Acidobacteria bacterium]|jgi:hypothetical protein|nr:MAG: hypothetical protein D6687_06825 [Acidobacteriota bacterium]GIU81328.1 MAG: hypothetical protein KatS3mg006_0392 [Pyrinomonadaceae bacterium]